MLRYILRKQRYLERSTYHFMPNANLGVRGPTCMRGFLE